MKVLQKLAACALALGLWSSPAWAIVQTDIVTGKTYIPAEIYRSPTVSYGFRIQVKSPRCAAGGFPPLTVQVTLLNGQVKTLTVTDDSIFSIQSRYIVLTDAPKVAFDGGFTWDPCATYLVTIFTVPAEVQASGHATVPPINQEPAGSVIGEVAGMFFDGGTANNDPATNCIVNDSLTGGTVNSLTGANALNNNATWYNTLNVWEGDYTIFSQSTRFASWVMVSLEGWNGLQRDAGTNLASGSAITHWWKPRVQTDRFGNSLSDAGVGPVAASNYWYKVEDTPIATGSPRGAVTYSLQGQLGLHCFVPSTPSSGSPDKIELRTSWTQESR